jgi:hypothetical protein
MGIAQPLLPRGTVRKSTKKTTDKLRVVKALRTAKARADFHVFDDCVYSYEYALAHRELAQLIGDEPVTSGLSDGVISASIDPKTVPYLARRLAYYDRLNIQGRSLATHQSYLSAIGGAIASSSGKAYMTHWMYPYKGKFHPQMIRALFNVMDVREGETVFDPMTGSGTVNVEASLMGIHSIGIDCSPVGILASQVKCDLLLEDVASSFAEQVPLEAPEALCPRYGLFNGSDHLLSPQPNGSVGNAMRLLEFEVMSICQLPGKDFAAIWRKIAGHYRETAIKCPRAVRELGIALGKPLVKIGDARKTGLPPNSVDGIICSPPYAIALDYVSRNEAQLEKLGHKLGDMYDVTIGLRGKNKERIDNYYADLEASIQEMCRVLRPGRYCTIVIGDTRFQNELLPTIQRAIDFGERAGFDLVANMRKISAGRFGLFRTESMLLFQKPA